MEASEFLPTCAGQNQIIVASLSVCQSVWPGAWTLVGLFIVMGHVMTGPVLGFHCSLIIFTIEIPESMSESVTRHRVQNLSRTCFTSF